MWREMMKSKLHRGTVTGANLNYTGSITIDARLMARANILPHEKVQVLNVSNGVRFETYAIEGEVGLGTICLNGAAARLVHPGDKVIIISYVLLSEEELKEHQPKVFILNSSNSIIEEENH